MHAPYEQHLNAVESATLSVSPLTQIRIVTHAVQPAMRAHTHAKETAIMLSNTRATEAVRSIRVYCAQRSMPHVRSAGTIAGRSLTWTRPSSARLSVGWWGHADSGLNPLSYSLRGHCNKYWW